MADLIRVLIVTDRGLLGECLTDALGRQEDLDVVAAADTGAAAVQRAREHHPAVVLLDWDLANGTAAVTAARIHTELPGVPVLILSDNPDQEGLLEAIESGPCGCAATSISIAGLVATLRLALDGQLVVSADVLRRLIERSRGRLVGEPGQPELLPDLTHRELQVLRLIAQGLDNRSIAAKLGVAVTTVRGHVRSILEKLGVHSKLAAVAKATQGSALEDVG